MAKQHAAQVAAMKQAEQLSQRVAQHLRRYDTDAVEAELVEYREECEQPDAQLLENYGALVENLNQYRPHLPNWMVGHADEEGVPSERTMTAPTSGHSISSRQSRRSVALSKSGGDRGGSYPPEVPCMICVVLLIHCRVFTVVGTRCAARDCVAGTLCAPETMYP
jgi:hypothetical protein